MEYFHDNAEKMCKRTGLRAELEGNGRLAWYKSGEIVSNPFE